MSGAGASNPLKRSQTPLPDNLSRHKDYYIIGGDLYFLLGKTYFRVHSYFFTRESRYWKDRLAGPTSPGDEQTLPGRHESTAITLNETVAEFSRFLWVFYNPRYGVYEKGTLDDWIMILGLASRWEFDEVRRLAITHIARFEMETVKRIKIYQQYKVPTKYLFPLYNQLATRPTMLKRNEYELLDKNTLCIISQARELLRAQPAEGGDEPISPPRADISPAQIFEIVANAFELKSEDREELRPPSPSINGTHPDPMVNGAGLGRGAPNLNSSGRTTQVTVRGKVGK